MSEPTLLSEIVPSCIADMVLRCLVRQILSDEEGDSLIERRPSIALPLQHEIEVVARNALLFGPAGERDAGKG